MGRKVFTQASHCQNDTHLCQLEFLVSFYSLEKTWEIFVNLPSEPSHPPSAITPPHYGQGTGDPTWEGKEEGGGMAALGG